MQGWSCRRVGVDHASAQLLSSTAHTAALLKDPNAQDYATRAVDALGPAKVKSRAVVLAEAALTTAMVGELELVSRLWQSGSDTHPRAGRQSRCWSAVRGRADRPDVLGHPLRPGAGAAADPAEPDGGLRE